MIGSAPSANGNGQAKLNGHAQSLDGEAAPGRSLGPIAVIAPCPFPANHGTPGSIREIVQCQVHMGYDVHVFTYPIADKEVPLEPMPTLHRVTMLGSSQRIKVGPMWRRPIWNLLIVLKICLAARKYKFKAIHAYNYEGALFGWLAHLWLRIPLVFHHFNTMIDELPSYNFIKPIWLASWLARALDYWAPRMSTKIIAISDPIEKFLLSKGIRRDRIVKIPMGVDPEIFKNRDGAKIRREYDLENRPVVMYAGLLNKFQRLDYLLQGMAVVVKSRPDARLVLVTNYIEPEDRYECDRLLDELQLREHVIITPPEPFERVPDYLAAADVCVVSRPDCPGVAVKMLNYMAAGKPIVVPAGSSMALDHGHDAYVVPDHDGAAIGNGVLALLADEPLRRRLGANAPLSLESRFGLRTICKNIGKVYLEVAGYNHWNGRPMIKPIAVAGEPKLRICVLAACPFPANHGTPGSIREISEAIAERGHDVRVVTYHIGQDIPLHGVKLHRITPLTRESKVVVGPTSRRPLYDLQMVFKALKLIRSQHVDVIHAHGYEAALAAWICKLITGVPVVYSGHNTMADELPSYDFIRPRILARLLAKFLDAFVPRVGTLCVPHSRNIERFFHDLGLAKRTEQVVNFGIDIDAVSRGDGQRIKQQYGLGAGPVILYAGVTDSFQRIDLLLEAMLPVLWYEPDAKLLLVVTIHQPKHLQHIHDTIERLGIGDSVIVTDPQTLSAIPDFLQACDVAVVPRPGASGFPIKLLNYMAARKPCVLYASSSSRLMHGHDAFLVAPDTSEALAEAIVHVLKDDELRERLAQNGYQFVRKNHDRRLTAERLCATYLKMLAPTARFRHVANRPRVMLRARAEHIPASAPASASEVASLVD